jgi:hypothetical protein
MPFFLENADFRDGTVLAKTPLFKSFQPKLIGLLRVYKRSVFL